MTSKKLKKTFTAAFLSGSILLQNFPALAAASDTTDWLKESPFRQDITTEKSTPTESVPSETETVSPFKVLRTIVSEIEFSKILVAIIISQTSCKSHIPIWQRLDGTARISVYIFAHIK